VNALPSRSRRIAGALAATAVVSVVAAAPATAAGGSDPVQVVNTETVQVYLDSSGKIDSQRVYEQLSLTGKGKVDLENPVSTDNLRNLDGFSGFDVEDGKQVVKATVDGEDKYRSVSDYDGKLPLKVSIAYKLDGKLVEPGDVVGSDGELEVIYTVENVTSQSQEVTFPDGKGGTVTKTADVPIPMVGSLTATAPPNFTNVKSDQANIAGDGEGGTKLSFTMTLFPPIGSDKAVFGYTADITDGVVPRSEITALPVNPLESPTFKSAADSYQGGADTGAELTAGATEIDSNLLKLRDGAADLLAGLIKLHGGAIQLNEGLTNEAAPGAAKLAVGANQLDDGLVRLHGGAQQLADGTGQLNDGAATLADGAGDAADGAGKVAGGANQLGDGLDQLGAGTGDLGTGADQLAAGQRKLAAGLTKLYDGVKTLPADVKAQLVDDPQYKALIGALASMAGGVGNRTDAPAAGTLLGGINAIQYGLRTPGGYGSNDCATALAGGTPSRCGAMDGVQFIAEQLSSGAGDLDKLKPVLGILNGVSGAGAAPCPGYPAYAPPPTPPTNACQAVATVYYGLFGSSPAPSGAQERVRVAAGALQGIQQQVGSQLLANGAGLDQLRHGLSTGADPTTCSTVPSPCGIKEAAQFLQLYGIPALVDGITKKISATLLASIGEPTPGCDPEKTLRCAAAALAEGGTQLTDGIDQLVAGVSKLQAGGADLAAGAGALSNGLKKLDSGADQLAAGAGQVDDGADQVAEGAGDAADGSGQIADGADTLADGLQGAADGSGQLADGLGEAANGAPKLVDGAQELSDKGTKKLVDAGEATAQDYGEMVAVMDAGAKRAESEDMAYGAPENALGLMAYKYVLQGEDGESGRNWARGLAGVALLAAGAGVFAVRRRLI
jgi:putative membrane protein